MLTVVLSRREQYAATSIDQTSSSTFNLPVSFIRAMVVLEYEELLDRIAHRGLYQWMLMLLLSISGLKNAMDYFALTIVTTMPSEWHCTHAYKLEQEGNRSVLTAMVPTELQLEAWNLSLTHFQCHTPILDAQLFNNQSFFRAPPSNNVSKAACRQWWYDHSQIAENLVTEFDLVCDHALYRRGARAAFMLGILVGGVIGQLADRFGRRPTLLLLAVWEMVSHMALAMAPDRNSYIVLRLLTGFSAALSGLSVLILTEQTSRHSRALFGNLFWATWCLGYVLV